MISGLKTLSSKLPLAPPMFTATSFPNTWAQIMVSASLWVGLTFPGMIELPGSFSGMLISPRPALGPDASQRTSLAIFISEQEGVVGGQRRELVWSADERPVRKPSDFRRRFVGEVGIGVQPGAYSRAAESELINVGQRHRDPL